MQAPDKRFCSRILSTYFEHKSLCPPCTLSGGVDVAPFESDKSALAFLRERLPGAHALPNSESTIAMLQWLHTKAFLFPGWLRRYGPAEPERKRTAEQQRAIDELEDRAGARVGALVLPCYIEITNESQTATSILAFFLPNHKGAREYFKRLGKEFMKESPRLLEEYRVRSVIYPKCTDDDKKDEPLAFLRAKYDRQPASGKQHTPNPKVAELAHAYDEEKAATWTSLKGGVLVFSPEAPARRKKQ